MALFDQIAREVHERMASLTQQPQAQPQSPVMDGQLDPRDTNRDGVVSDAEAAAYVHDYLASAPAEEREALLRDYVGNLSPEQRRSMGDAIVKSSANPVQSVNADDTADLAGAIGRTAQAPAAAGGKSPLEDAFGEGGALGSPLVKAGLVGLAAAIGSQMLRGQGNRARDHR